MSILFTQTAENQGSQHSSETDSIFGLVLTQSFMGMAYGAGAEQVWEAGEMASEIYSDRAKNRTNGHYQLGVRQSLGGDFARQAQPEELRHFQKRYLPDIAAMPVKKQNAAHLTR